SGCSGGGVSCATRVCGAGSLLLERWTGAGGGGSCPCFLVSVFPPLSRKMEITSVNPAPPQINAMVGTGLCAGVGAPRPESLELFSCGPRVARRVVDERLCVAVSAPKTGRFISAVSFLIAAAIGRGAVLTVHF